MTIRNFSLWYQNKKVAEAFRTKVGLLPNRKRVYGAEGYFGHTRGAVDTDVEADVLVPVEGISVNLIQDVLAQKDVDLKTIVGSVAMGGKFAITNGEIESQMPDGSCTGKFKFEGKFEVLA